MINGCDFKERNPRKKCAVEIAGMVKPGDV
jgi:hypothetical protein